MTAGLTVAGPVDAAAQCPVVEVAAGLRFPLGIAQSSLGNLLVAETGAPGIPNTGRISIVGPSGGRRTLLDGLPSGTNDVGEPSGPAGLFLRGRTLYIAIGIGDAGVPGPAPGSLLENPSPSSPIFSSVLAIHFSASVEMRTQGFWLDPADHLALALGQPLRLTQGAEVVTVELVANFPDFTPAPRPDVPANVRGVNPFDLVAMAGVLYVTDGGQNLVWQVDIGTGAASTLATFAGEAVPTGIRDHDGDLLVALFGGFPFAAGASVIVRVDPETGQHQPLIGGLKTAIDVIPLRSGRHSTYLVLQHTSQGILGPPGLLLEVQAGQPAATVADCLTRPTSMTRDRRSRVVYVTEIIGGRVVAVH